MRFSKLLRILCRADLTADLKRVSSFYVDTLKGLEEELALAHELAAPILSQMRTGSAPGLKPRSRSFDLQSSSPQYSGSTVTTADTLLEQEPLLRHQSRLQPANVSEEISTPSFIASLSTAPPTLQHPSPEPLQKVISIAHTVENMRSVEGPDVRTREGFKRWLTDLHRTATQLQNFQMLNHTGFVKLFKKLRPPTWPAHCRSNMFDALGRSALVTDTHLTGALLRLQSLFADLFTDGDISTAKVSCFYSLLLVHCCLCCSSGWWLFSSYVHARKGVTLPLAWNAGDVSPPGRSRRSDSRAAVPVL